MSYQGNKAPPVAAIMDGMHDGPTLPEMLLRADWDAPGASRHLAQFYESDAFLLDSLSEYVAGGLAAGESVVVVATDAHRVELEHLLLESGLDLDAARTSGHYIELDAAETLSTFMVEGDPDAGRFMEQIGQVLARTPAGRRARVFGEMVALLWAQESYEAALRLEALWNQLQATHSLSLYCAYPIYGFDGEAFVKPLSDVCAQHTHIIPAESYSALSSPAEQLLTIVQLQQKARMLEAEIAERKQAEAALRVVKEELEVQVKDLRRLHQLSGRLAGTLEIEPVLREVLQAALAVQDADLGLLSLYNPERGVLELRVSSGFDEAFRRAVERVPAGSGPWGACYEERRQIVVEDVERDPLFAPYREAARAADIRACHSIPLISRSGEVIGVLSAHSRAPHRPSVRAARLMDLYARMAADMIENARLHQQVQRELREREQSLLREHRARADAESASRLKDEFLATVSHELRTPLTSILGWAHMLRKGGRDEATVARGLEIIERSARTQAQLVEDILDISQVITGKIRLDIGPVDLAAVINAAIDSLQPAADARNVHLSVMLDPSARHISGDASRLQQVFWNLLSNAVKFTPSGGRVEVGLQRAGANVEIRVRDTGEGIRPDFLPFLFDYFRQADGAASRRYGGLGLGLALVRHFVELHGGTVQAYSAGEGQGATFTVYLPLPAGRPGSDDGGSVFKEEIPERQALLASLEGIFVLLVGDDLVLLQLLTAMLTEAGAAVQATTDAAEALELLEVQAPTVLVSDLAMRGEGGASLIETLRARDATRGARTPAVALTAHGRVEERMQALAAGFDMFVPKPIQANELITVLTHLAHRG